MTLPNPVGWAPSGAVVILDQTRLPAEECQLQLETVEQVVEAIRTLRVRGAPLIGIVAAMGVTLAANGRNGDGPALLDAVLSACDLLEEARPTAVNLSWAMRRMRQRAMEAARSGDSLKAALLAEANAIWQEDRAMCQRIGQAGESLLPDGATVLTHCNAGILATGGIGTALAPIYLAHQRGRRVSVVATETRPLLQGSRLTAWELGRAGIPVTLITDGMVASRLGRGDVACVIVGADRIAANGDVANKIGTYGVALAARAARVPFYVAAPRSTYDPGTPNGSAIPIEERRPDEVREFGARVTAPAGQEVWNPAFDVTPSGLVTGYLTDEGLLTRTELPVRLG
jgi:methylthioribose-1-phosphate isomerase